MFPAKRKVPMIFFASVLMDNYNERTIILLLKAMVNHHCTEMKNTMTLKTCSVEL